MIRHNFFQNISKSRIFPMEKSMELDSFLKVTMKKKCTPGCLQFTCRERHSPGAKTTEHAVGSLSLFVSKKQIFFIK